jgi:hypothetical protein
MRQSTTIGMWYSTINESITQTNNQSINESITELNSQSVRKFNHKLLVLVTVLSSWLQCFYALNQALVLILVSDAVEHNLLAHLYH